MLPHHKLMVDEKALAAREETDRGKNSWAESLTC